MIDASVLQLVWPWLKNENILTNVVALQGCFFFIIFFISGWPQQLCSPEHVCTALAPLPALSLTTCQSLSVLAELGNAAVDRINGSESRLDMWTTCKSSKEEVTACFSSGWKFACLLGFSFSWLLTFSCLTAASCCSFFFSRKVKYCVAEQYHWEAQIHRIGLKRKRWFEFVQ